MKFAMFGSVMPLETLQLGSGCRGWGLRESRGYGGMRLGRERMRFDFEKSKSIWFLFLQRVKWLVFEIFSGII